MNSFGPPILAVGINEVLALIFVLVSVISWIIRQVQGNNQQMPPPVQRPGRRREERVNDELDSFLQQVNRSDAKKSGDGQRQGTPNRPKPPGNRGPATASQKATAAKQAAPPEPPPSRRIREEQPPRPVGSDLGGSLTQHVREHMAERVVKEAQRDVGQDVKDSVQKHMGQGLRTMNVGGTSGPARTTPDQLFHSKDAQAAACCGRADKIKNMLRSPESIRQAIIIQEIMNRPKCLR